METINNLFLELSQVATVTTAKEEYEQQRAEHYKEAWCAAVHDIIRLEKMIEERGQIIEDDICADCDSSAYDKIDQLKGVIHRMKCSAATALKYLENVPTTPSVGFARAEVVNVIYPTGEDDDE